MEETGDIQGLNTGVGLVPQGRLGSGIANVFDTSSISNNLAKLGARMENLEKLKLATAAKLAAAKQKEAVVKGIKSTPFEAVAATGKAAFRSGQKVNKKLYESGLKEYTEKKAAGDVEGANQVVPLTKFASENVNNKTASIESDIDNWWKNGAGKFYLPNNVVESNIESNRPDEYDKYLGYDELTTRNQSYKDQPATYNFDAVGQWAKDESGRTTLQKTLPDGTFAGFSGLSALYKLPMKKNGQIDENADLQIDYDIAKNFYSTNPYVREQMRTFGEVEKEKAMLSDDYKNATTEEKRNEVLKNAVDQGENSYIYATLAGRADKDIRKNLEATYRRAAAQKKAEGDVEKDYQFGNQNLNIRGRFDAQSVKDPNVTKGTSVEYNYGVVPNYNFKKNPQELSTGTDIVPMGDPKVLEMLGVIKKTRYANGKVAYTLGRNVKFGSASYVQNATINNTANRVVNKDWLMPTGILVPTGQPAYQGDTPAEGYVLNIISGPISVNLTKAQQDYLTDRGIDLTQINTGLEIPMFVEKTKGAGATLTTFLENEFPGTLPKSKLTTSKY